MAPLFPSCGADQGTAGPAYANRTANASGRRQPPCYVGFAVRVSPCKAVLIAVVPALIGCGSADRRDRADDVRTVQIARVAFPKAQRLAQPVTFSITVRNAGDEAIGNLVVTLSGLSERTADGTQRPLWVVDDAPPEQVAATDDTRAAGPLAAGEETTLRWRLTPTAQGIHDVTYEVAAGVRDAPRAQLPDGGQPRATVTVGVTATPPHTRVDPGTGRVVGE